MSDTMTLTKKGERLSKAILIAVLTHLGQFDKGGNPYIRHPLTVMHKLKTDDEDAQCAAVLHDVIEDGSGKIIMINGREREISFAMLLEEGMSVATVDAVRALTKLPGQTYAEYQAGILANTIAMLVKRKDLRTNSDLRRLKRRSITEKDIARVAKYMAFYARIEDQLDAVNKASC